jgi:ankyrin repeat protein
MTARILIISAFALTSILSAAELSNEDLLRQGLFEEEANRDFEKAIECYRAVVAAHDRQRSLAATATFRLGEIARKKNDKEAAAAAFRTVAERFPEQADLARLSRENLSALGMSPILASEAQTTDVEEIEIARLQVIAKSSPDLLDGANEIGWRPIHKAAEKGQTKVLAYLLENKADANGRTTKEGLTPLHLASIHGHLAVVNALLAEKAELDRTFSMLGIAKTLPTMSRNAEGVGGEWSALDLAVLYDRREIAKTLIKAGADVKRFGPSPDQSYPYTTLLIAIYLGRDELAQALIAAGSPLDRVASEGAPSPLLVALKHNPNMAAILIKAGASPILTDDKRYGIPLHLAARSNQLEMAKLFLEAGSDPRATDDNGMTALHGVTSPEMVDLLISKGADVNALDQGKRTPFVYAFLWKPSRIPLLEAFLKHGAIITDADSILQIAPHELLPFIREKVLPRQSLQAK